MFTIFTERDAGIPVTWDGGEVTGEPQVCEIARGITGMVPGPVPQMVPAGLDTVESAYPTVLSAFHRFSPGTRLITVGDVPPPEKLPDGAVA